MEELKGNVFNIQRFIRTVNWEFILLNVLEKMCAGTVSKHVR